MSVGMRLVAVVLAAAPILGAAQGEAGLSCIKDVVYSQEFLARYPKAGAACREVVQINGEKWVRFDADVVKVKGNQVTANFLDSYKTAVGTVTFAATPDARVVVDGKKTKYSALRQGDTLTFWVPESRMGFYAAPGASESTKLAVVSDTAKQR
jgi:hypothetical protein